MSLYLYLKEIKLNYGCEIWGQYKHTRYIYFTSQVVQTTANTVFPKRKTNQQKAKYIKNI